ncbi:MAG TPA: ABC-2 family transporter protein [Thermogutta sp.]|nr:ABC-2 family transporter protein [Thermogutta sp.]
MTYPSPAIVDTIFAPVYRWRLWITILRISIQERIIYRGDFMLGTLMRFLPIITQIFLWGAVFSALPTGNGSEGRIVGYSYHDMVAYYLLTMLSRAFSSMPGLASGITREIREGTIKRFIVQPIGLLEYLFFYRLAHKLVYYSVAIVPFAVVFYLCRGFFQETPHGVVWAAYIASLVLAFLLGFFLEATLGLLGFWFLEVSSFLFIYMLLSFFFSGHMFPIDMLPEPMATVVKLIPLQYLAYFPAAVFLGKVQGAALVTGLLVQAGWVIVFAFLAQVALRRGLRHYSGFGG